MGNIQEKKSLRGKYLFDRVFSLAALLLLSPAILAIELIIIKDDPSSGPVFSQIRIGQGGKPFRMYKFRTMRTGAEKELEQMLSSNEMEGPPFKIRDDSRITGPGRFLRKSGLDEILQFINVLKGDMSVVGPRPPLPREAAMYNDYQKQRLSVRPGITCYWQIMPDRNSIPFDEWVRLDLKYIKECSPAVDLKIMIKTVTAMKRLQGQ